MSATFTTVLGEHVSQLGNTLNALSAETDVLVVFLRHSGCTFCREALDDLRKLRPKLAAAGTKLALVHLAQENDREGKFFAEYGMHDVDRFSDPDKALYQAFELKRGTFGQLLGPAVWWRGMLVFFRGHGLGMLNGDGLQMPGAFVLRDGAIVKAYRHTTAASRPDYEGAGVRGLVERA
ncbi:MAG: SelL-related redox protein [Pirellulales bacterium]